MVWWLLFSCVPPWPGDTLIADPTVGFILSGGIDGPGWSAAHDAGRIAVRDALDLPTGYRAEVEPHKADAAIEALIEEGNNIIFTTRYDYVGATLGAALAHEDKLFFSCGGRASGPNLASYGARTYQSTYLAGRIAAQTSCTKRLGFVASVPDPDVIRNINAFAIGAREVVPEAVVEVRFLDAWSDPQLETTAINVMIGHGVDTFIHQTDSELFIDEISAATATCGEETESPVYGISYGDTAPCEEHPDRCLMAITWNWGPLYVDLLSKVIDGSIDFSEIRFEPFARDPAQSVLTLWGPGDAVEEDLWSNLLEKRDALTLPSNRSYPFHGPVDDNDGGLRISDDDTLSDEALDEMCWFVDGVINGITGDGPAEVPKSCLGED